MLVFGEGITTKKGKIANDTPPVLVGHFSKRRLKKYCGNTVASCEDLTTSAWALRNDHHRIQPPPRWIVCWVYMQHKRHSYPLGSFWGELLIISGHPILSLRLFGCIKSFLQRLRNLILQVLCTWQLQRVCSLLVDRDALVTLDPNISKDGVRDLQTFIFATKYSTWLPCVLWHLHPPGPLVPKDSRNHLEMTAGLAFVDEWLLVSMVRG